MKRIAVLISGGGSNLQALIDACADGTIAARIVLVVSNRAGAFGLQRAKRAGIESATLALKGWMTSGGSREGYDAEVAAQVNAALPDMVVLAGWMHVFGAGFLDAMTVPVINLHPALPGRFAGTHAIERALEAFRRGEIAGTGVMVHEVVAEVDAGPVLGTAPVAIERTDDLASLSERMHAAEHDLLVRVVRDWAAKPH